jgi:hypothetical protein
MKIIAIFEPVENALLSVQYDDKELHEWKDLIDCWTNVHYLRTFFKKNERILNGEFYGGITVKDAVTRTLKEAKILEKTILELAKNGKSDKKETLQTIFIPLNNNEVKITQHQQTKAKLPNKKASWLRVYAIRISENLFVISGGGIKLTHWMDESDHLKIELEKLEITKKYLIDKDVLDEDDYETLEISL